MRTFSSTSFYMLMAVGAVTAGLSLSAAIHLPNLGAAVATLPTSMQFRGSGRVTPEPDLTSRLGQAVAQGHRGSGRITPGLTQTQLLAGHRGSGRAPASLLA